MNFDEFKFAPATLDAPRPPGISAYMRIKNGAQFLRLVVESHLPYYDEIVCVYNDCEDDTAAILKGLQRRHGDKIKVYEYLPKVHPMLTPEHIATPTESIHGLANYYNWTLAKCSFNTATKLDDDHLAIDCNLKPAIDLIRRAVAAGVQKLYFFSGVNLMLKDGEIVAGGYAEYPFSGQGDICYHPVNSKMFYRQGDFFEKFNKYAVALKNREYVGLLYFHLAWLQKNGTEYSDDMPPLYSVPLADFGGKKNMKRLISQLTPRNRVRYAISRCTGRKTNMKVTRLLRLQDDLRGIDFERDVFNKLRNLI